MLIDMGIRTCTEVFRYQWRNFWFTFTSHVVVGLTQQGRIRGQGRVPV